jgi:hypothetical protein
MSSLIHKLSIKNFNFAGLLVLYIIIIIIMILDQEICAQKWFSTNYLLTPILRKWVWDLEHSFLLAD